VEVRPVGTAFTGTPTQTGDRVAKRQNGFVLVPGSRTTLGITGRRGQQTRPAGRAIGARSAETPKQRPTSSTAVPEPPNAPTALAQFQNDGNTAIAVGGTALSASFSSRPA